MENKLAKAFRLKGEGFRPGVWKNKTDNVGDNMNDILESFLRFSVKNCIEYIFKNNELIFDCKNRMADYSYIWLKTSHNQYEYFVGIEIINNNVHINTLTMDNDSQFTKLYEILNIPEEKLKEIIIKLMLEII